MGVVLYTNCCGQLCARLIYSIYAAWKVYSSISLKAAFASQVINILRKIPHPLLRLSFW